MCVCEFPRGKVFAIINSISTCSLKKKYIMWNSFYRKVNPKAIYADLIRGFSRLLERELISLDFDV